MPYIIITNTYPSHKQNDVTKKFLELIPKYPPDESLGEIVAQPVRFTNNGFKIVTTYEVKEGKLEDVFTRLSTYAFEFKDIEGYESAIEVVSTFPEAIEIAGIPVPE